MDMSTRARHAVLILGVLIGSWYGMMAVHELGHVLGASATGGRVERVVLEFTSFSRTDVHPNPSPLLVAWAGPLVGVTLPCLCWAAAAATRWRRAPLLRFWAGFCLLANGAYIGAGSFGRVGDAGDLINHGSPPWTLWTFGLTTACAGLALWNGTGRYFGLDRTPSPTGLSTRASITWLMAWMAVVAIV